MSADTGGMHVAGLLKHGIARSGSRKKGDAQSEWWIH